MPTELALVSGGSSEAPPPLRFREVTTETWGDLERLFESRGGPKACWCLVWRDPKRKGDKSALRAFVDGGRRIGLLGYEGETPVAWCSIAPRSTFRPGLAEVSPGDEGERVWSLTCFFLTRRLRQRGVFGLMLDAAVSHARSQGATLLEAYPLAPDSPSYRFCGPLPAFRSAGFVEIGRAGSRRHVVRLSLVD